ncbi:YDG domain-containing protein [Pedobacter ureilyticus]|uniref:YDG domain-containing protein n=1 Tax=Pedobacter ureilyticus TaxID=1393051 RepID=A0ABW9J9F9_9SPHI|nr:YDG domain-containing protein [Pedobacter helvus]
MKKSLLFIGLFIFCASLGIAQVSLRTDLSPKTGGGVTFTLSGDAEVNTPRGAYAFFNKEGSPRTATVAISKAIYVNWLHFAWGTNVQGSTVEIYRGSTMVMSFKWPGNGSRKDINQDGVTSIVFKDDGTSRSGLGELSEINFISPATVPTVSTSEPASVTSNAAFLGGNVTSDGNEQVIESGIIYSQSATDLEIGKPNVIKMVLGFGTGPFNTYVNGLTGSKYYVRAYAKNQIGTSYGEIYSFTLKPLISVNSTLIMPLNNTYGSTSQKASVEINGSNLTADILVIPPAGFELSLDDMAYSETLTVINTGNSVSAKIFIRLKDKNPVGEYSGNIVFTSSGATPVSVSMSPSYVAPRTLFVRANSGQSKTYGDADPTFTYTIGSPGLAFGDQLTGSLSRTENENVGSYLITKGTLATTSNYILDFIPLNTFAIHRRPITISVNTGQAKVYGNVDPTFAYTVGGSGLAFNDKFSGILGRTNGENVGSYAITQGSLSVGPNYALTFNSGTTFSINKRKLSVTVGTDQSKIYGNADPVLYYTVGGSGLAFNDVFNGRINRISGENVGSYAIAQGTLSLSNNYELAFTGGTFTINKRRITVSANAGQTKVYGDRDPVLTYSVGGSGLAFGDKFSGSLDRTNGENVGFYDIKQGTLYAGGNYDVTYDMNTSLSITAKSLTLKLNSTPLISRVYDRTNFATLAAGNYILEGVEMGDEVAVTGTATYDNSNVGMGKTITVKGFVLSGPSSGNYTVPATALSTAGSIAQKVLSLALNSAPAINKVYDKTNSATLAVSNYTLGGIEMGDEVSVTGTATYNNSNVGTGKTIMVNGFVLSGPSSGNYTVPATALITVGSITQKALTLALNSSPVISKVYDKTNNATLTDGNYTLSGIETGDAVTVSGTATYDNANAGTGKTITVKGFVLSGSSSANYSLPALSLTTAGSITQKALTLVLNSSPVISKVYDKTNNATLSAGNYTLSGIEVGDAVAVSGTGTYDNANVGTGKTITVKGFVLSGPSSLNYSVPATTLGIVGSITQKVLTLALKNSPLISKIYDKTNIATLADGNYTLDGIEMGDDVSVAGTATYDNSNVGIGKAITVNDFILSGPSRGNYSLLATALTTMGSITPKLLSLALNNDPVISKVYDRNNSVTLAAGNYSLGGIENGDEVSITGTARYDDANVGIRKTVTVKSFVLSGPSSANYSLPVTVLNAVGSITQKALTLALNNSPLISKVYDKTNNATLAAGNYTLGGIETGDNVSVNGVATYEDANVGTNKTVTVNGLVLSGPSSRNYSLPTTILNTVGSITPKALTLVLNNSPLISKVYDKTNNATLVAGNYTLGGIETGDDVSVNGHATYENANVGIGKTITVNGFVLSGSSSGNYSVPGTVLATDGSITQKTLTLALNSSPAITKVYDKTATATLSPANYNLSGVVPGDNVAVSGTASFDNESVGTGKTITVKDFVLAGASAVNYGLSTTTASTTGTITQKALTLALNASPMISKVYDKNNTATLASGNYSLTGVLSGDQVSVSGTAVYDNVNVGTGKTVTVNNFVLGGAANANYSLSTTSATTIGVVTAKALTITAAAKTKVYGEADPALTYSSSGLVGTDAITGTLSRTTGENVGTYAINQNTLSAGGNYSITYVGANLGITAKALTITAAAKTKVYGEADPALTYSSSGLVGTDAITGTLSRATGENVGIYAINQNTLSAGGNYSVTYVGANLGITAKALTITAAAKTKVYGEADPALTYSSSGLVGTDAITGTLSRATGENVGTYAINQNTLSAGGNYSISYTGANLAINKAVLTVRANNAVMCQGNTLPTLGISYSGFKFTDSEASLGTRPTVTTTATRNSPAGTYTLVPNGAVSNNYSFIYVNGQLTINALPVVSIASSNGLSVSKGATLQLTATGGTSYSWSSANGIIGGQNSAVLTVRPSQTTTYTVTATNANGCSQSSSVTITVQEDYMMISGTNILTPNGDGKNDYLIIRNIDMYPNSEIRIFDIAGRMVYSKKAYDNSWDGTFNGSPLAKGTYYYIIDFGDGKARRKGFVSIVRD